MTEYWLLGPFVLCGALLGYLTNCLAIWMLFHPRRRLHLGIFRVQGFIPSRQGEIADKVARAIAQHLLDEKEMRKILGGINISEHLRPVVNEIVARELRVSLANRFRLAAAIQERVIVVIQERLGARLPHTLNDLHEVIASSVLGDIDLQAHLRARLDALDLDQLESLVWEVGRRELRTIEYLGGVIGAVVGLVQGFVFLLVM
jgi:uncharacterized membrane protein YheB (UPF0754 family)